MTAPALLELSADDLMARIEDFTELLHATVHAGASIGFILPFPKAEARVFWERKVAPELATGGRILWAADLDGRLVGTAQLGLEQFPNQAHRGDVMKLLVHPGCRRKGIARKLMVALEARARASGKSLLTLDTRSGDMAEPLYLSLGYEIAGRIPDYCRAPETDRLEATSYMYKKLLSSAPAL